MRKMRECVWLPCWLFYRIEIGFFVGSRRVVDVGKVESAVGGTAEAIE